MPEFFNRLRREKAIISAEIARLRADNEALRNRLEQETIRLAGCLTAAEGAIHDPATRGMHGWSPAYQAVLDLRIAYEALRQDKERLDWMETLIDVQFWHNKTGTVSFSPDNSHMRTGETLRAAIDAARAKEKGNG